MWWVEVATRRDKTENCRQGDITWDSQNVRYEILRILAAMYIRLSTLRTEWSGHDTLRKPVELTLEILHWKDGNPLRFAQNVQSWTQSINGNDHLLSRRQTASKMFSAHNIRNMLAHLCLCYAYSLGQLMTDLEAVPHIWGRIFAKI